MQSSTSRKADHSLDRDRDGDRPVPQASAKEDYELLRAELAKLQTNARSDQMTTGSTTSKENQGGNLNHNLKYVTFEVGLTTHKASLQEYDSRLLGVSLSDHLGEER